MKQQIREQTGNKKQLVDLDVNLELKEMNHVITQCIPENGRIYGLTAYLDNFIVKSNQRSLAKSNTRTPAEREK